MDNKLIEKKKYKDLNENFEIPIYQRQYAWKPEHVETLLNDLLNWEKEEYFLGNIVIKENNGNLEVIDGQQRLTTLYLISFFSNEIVSFNLSYKIREEANNFLQSVRKNKKILEDKKNIPEELIDNINTIENWVKDNKISSEKIQNLLEKIIITITKLPEETDVEKFFEVMNNRGKQLEQHQVLKAKFLEVLKEEEEENKNTTNNINYSKTWDFCSNMNYMIEDLVYYSLIEKQRNDNKLTEIRKKLLKFVKYPNSVPEYFQKSDSKNQSLEERNTILDIIKPEKNKNKDTNTETEEFYLPNKKEISAPINFSVFLLHILKIFLKGKENEFRNKWEDIELDDKKLLKQFLDEDNRLIFDKKVAEEFIEFLLKIRILFDYFIFKRGKNEKGEETVFIKGEDENRDYKSLLNLQLLFSFTSPNYQHQEWSTPVLHWLLKNYKENKEHNEEFTEFLKNLDKHLALERLEENPKLKEVFNKFIENPNYNKESPTGENLKEKLNQKLNKGTTTEHYWFYKLEYLLGKDFNELINNKNDKNNKNVWKKLASNTQNYLNIPWESKNNEDKSLKTLIGSYRLTRKNSIEHIQPRSTAKEKGWEEGNQCDDKCQIDCFGNLALISSYLNSKLINQDFEEKRRDIQKQLDNGTIESLKMLLVYSKYKEWTPENCKKHHDEMINLLTSSLKNSLENKS